MTESRKQNLKTLQSSEEEIFFFFPFRVIKDVSLKRVEFEQSLDELLKC